MGRQIELRVDGVVLSPISIGQTSKWKFKWISLSNFITISISGKKPFLQFLSVPYITAGCLRYNIVLQIPGACASCLAGIFAH
jgi:hypothetical protein